jgi:signal transduction histidine kinase
LGISDTQFRAALETMLDIVLMTTAVRDDDGRIVDFKVDYLNPAGEIGGRRADEIVGRRMLELWPGTASSPIRKMYLHLTETGEPVILDNFEYSTVIEGVTRTAFFDIRATRLGDGFLQNFRDATARYRMQQDLASSEKRFRSAVDALLDPFFMLGPVRDDQGQIVELEYLYVNQAALRLYNMSEQEIIGHGQLELFPSVRELGIFDTYLDAIETGTPTRIDVPTFDENGVAGAFELAVTPGEEGLIVGARDVSGVRRAQEALAVLNADLEERVAQRTSELVRAEADRRALETGLRRAERLETVGQLTSGIAHDFRNLLAAIVGYAEMAEDVSGVPDSELKRILAEIHGTAGRAVHLTRDLLRFSRRARTRPGPVDINALIAEMMDLLSVSMSGSADLIFELSPKPLPLVLADRGQLEQVLLNLAVNARDAMPDGGSLTVSTSPADCYAERFGAGAGQRRYVEITMRDTGIGMSPEVSAKIFERFFTTKPAGTGTGLGLSTAQGIVAATGGTIEVESAEGHGTAFRIYLPATSPPASEPSVGREAT